MEKEKPTSGTETPPSEEAKGHTPVKNSQNIITPSKLEYVEQEILIHERRRSYSYTIDWPEPSKLLVFIVVKRNDHFAAVWAMEMVESCKVSVAVEPVLAPKEKKEGLYAVNEVDLSKVNVIITVGSDGTILWAHRYYKHGSIPPVIAFHLGQSSYLTHFEPKEYKTVLSNALNLLSTYPHSMYKIEAKSRIECTLLNNPNDPTPSKSKKNFASLVGAEASIDKIKAMNDITIDRGSSQFLTNIECFINGKYLTTIQADGIVISTPCGSTAYNMAAGGSLVHFSIPGLLFTPICPFSLSFRPIVFPEDVQLVFKVPLEARSSVFVSVDGHTRFELEKGEGVEIKTSKYPASYVVNSSLPTVSGWFTNVKSMLNWNAKTMKRIDSMEDI